LTKHDILGHTTAVVKFTEASSLKKNLNRFLERTTHESTGVVSVDAVTCNRHKMTALSHDVNKKCHVSVVDVGSVKGQDHGQLLEETSTSCFDTENTEDFDERVTVRVGGIDTLDG
jgi:hypothetical protein